VETVTPFWLIAAAVALILIGLTLERRHHARTRTLAVVRPTRRMRRDVPHSLYCYPHRLGGIVYVGISNNPYARHRGHAAKSPWFGQSTGEMQVIARYPNWAAARVAEDALIARLALEGHPVANDQGNPLRRSRRAA
jgi:hypothetical protein